MKIKVCSKCKKKKPLSEFTKDKNRKDGLYPYCKNCRKKDGQINSEQISIKKKEFRKKFPWKQTLVYINQRCNNPNHPKYDRYGGRGIECRITEQELEYIWFRDEAYLLKQPSIDRKDNDDHYEYPNCQYIEKLENMVKDKRKSILQYDLEGNFIKEWGSIRDIERELGFANTSIGKCALGKRNHVGGFIWRYKNNL